MSVTTALNTAAAKESVDQPALFFTEVKNYDLSAVVSQLIGRDRVHNQNTDDEGNLRAHRLGDADMNRRCFVLMDSQNQIVAAVYAHIGTKPILGDKDISGDLESILLKKAEPVEGMVHSVQFYSISAFDSAPKGVGAMLIKYAHARCVDDYPNARIMTLSPLRTYPFPEKQEFEGALTGETKRWYALHHLICKAVLDPVQAFHLGNGATIANVFPDSDISDHNNPMVAYEYDRDPAVNAIRGAEFRKAYAAFNKTQPGSEEYKRGWDDLIVIVHSRLSPHLQAMLPPLYGPGGLIEERASPQPSI